MDHLLKPVAFVTWVAKTLASAVLLFLIFSIFSPKLDSADHKSAVLGAVKPVESRLYGLTRKYLLTRYDGKDITRYVAPGAALVLLVMLGSLHARVLDRIVYFQNRKETEALQKQAAGSGSQALKKSTEQLSSKLDEINAASRGERKKLLKDFVKLKRQLESMGRDLAFLSIDVVDSTGMKIGEDKYVISNDFAEYRTFVETRINAHGCVKSTWTPDGLMACFAKLEDAILAAQSILKDLGEFNRNVKSMKRDFIVRCGINAGHIFFDDTLPLEQISDRVIDIAGHMQKHAEPNTIYMAKQIVKPVEAMSGFNEAAAEIDGFAAYKWERAPAPAAVPA